MNASRLLENVQLMIDVEKQKRIQDALNNANATLSNLVGNPSQPTHQSEFAQALDKLRTLLDEARNSFQPAQFKLLEEIGAAKYFSVDLAADITSWIGENVATPAVAQEKLVKLIGDREAYLTQISQLCEGLLKLGIAVSSLEEGQAEIGFLLPRDLFDNEFEHLLKELEVVKKIIRAFSEAATGSVEPIEVRQISSSDPLFFFGLHPATIAMIGAAVTWALHTWKKVEEIRQIRAQTAKIAAFKDDPIERLFDDKIKQQVEKAVVAHTAKIIKGVKDRSGRKNEQEIHIRWALESIITRVERGMTVEIRLLPPPRSEGKEGEELHAVPPVYDDLSKIANQLVFPKMEGEPVLELPPSDPDGAV